MDSKKINKILFFKLPIAWVAGVRLKSISKEVCETKVKLTRMSQNPFKSMFWAVQGMAAEFTTGFMCMSKIMDSGKNISMLVVQQSAKFNKKAVGKIVFRCEEGKKIDDVLQKAIETGEGHILELTSRGYDQEGDIVSEFKFVWSFKLKK